MSQENVELVRAAIEVNRSGDIAAAVAGSIELSHPSVEFRSALAGLEGGVYRGHDGVRKYFDDMAESWQEWRNESAEIEELAPGIILATFVFRAIGKDSGVPVERRSAVIWTLSDGKVLSAVTYASRAEALEAVGRSE